MLFAINLKIRLRVRVFYEQKNQEMRASSLIVLVDTLKDYNTKPSILNVYFKNNVQFQGQCMFDRCLAPNRKQ